MSFIDQEKVIERIGIDRPALNDIITLITYSTGQKCSTTPRSVRLYILLEKQYIRYNNLLWHVKAHI